MSLLPLLEPVAAQAAHCSYCAKLCRYTCPVAEITGRESVTPWGINRAIDEAARSGVVSQATADTVYACSGCRGCGSACLPGLDLPTHVRAARAEVVAAGLAPPAALAAAGVETAVGGALLAGASAGAALMVFTGCNSEDGDALAAILSAAGVAWDVPREAVCCGARSVDVGLAEQGGAQGAQATRLLAGAERVVVMDPHCARRLAYDLGEQHVVTLPTLLAELVDALPLAAATAPVVWHDPCWLGRGMSEYDAARAVVQVASGAPAVEPEFSRDRTHCTGGGMAFDAVFVEAGQALREQRADELRAVGADTLPVVTACPTAAARLRSTGLNAHDLAGWLQQRLVDAETKEAGA